MKKLLVIILFPIALISCSSFDSDTFIKNKVPFQKSIRIAVLPFIDAPGFVDSGVNVSDAITSRIIRIKDWNVVERSQLPKILNEQVNEASGMTKEDYSKIGKLTNVDYLIVGSVSEYYHDRAMYIVPKTKLTVNMRIINTTTGEIAGTGRYVYETGKHAWCGCCILGWYYLPILLLSDENINNDLSSLASNVADDIEDQIED